MTDTIQMICIVCPNGCRLTVTQDGAEIRVENARCKKGQAFAEAELTHPMRALSSTVATVFPDMPRLPVKTRAEIPKEKMQEAMQKIRAAKVTTRLKMGDVVIADVCGTDVVATMNL